MKLIVIPQGIRKRISDTLKIVHEEKKGYSKEIKSSIQRQITVLENRIEKAFQDKLDDNITLEQWKKYSSKWQTEKDKLVIQLEEINKLDKQFYSQANLLLTFTDNAHGYFIKGTIEQRRKILEIISEEITYKNKNFNIKLKPVFQTIVENQYLLTRKSDNNRTLRNGIIKEVETNSTPNNRKNSL